MRPHRGQPTTLPHPWDSPGKNTGVGCHFLLQCMNVESESEVIQSCLTLATPWTAAYQAPPSMGFSRQEYWSAVPLPSLDTIHRRPLFLKKKKKKKERERGKLSLSLLYFNKTLLHKSSELSSLVSGPGLNSSPEDKNPSIFRGSATTIH